MYGFVIIRRPSKMMKDVDAIFRYIDPLINTQLVATFIMRDNDVREHPFSYTFDVFFI